MARPRPRGERRLPRRPRHQRRVMTGRNHAAMSQAGLPRQPHHSLCRRRRGSGQCRPQNLLPLLKFNRPGAPTPCRRCHGCRNVRGHPTACAEERAGAPQNNGSSQGALFRRRHQRLRPCSPEVSGRLFALEPEGTEPESTPRRHLFRLLDGLGKPQALTNAST